LPPAKERTVKSNYPDSLAWLFQDQDPLPVPEAELRASVHPGDDATEQGQAPGPEVGGKKSDAVPGLATVSDSGGRGKAGVVPAAASKQAAGGSAKLVPLEWEGVVQRLGALSAREQHALSWSLAVKAVHRCSDTERHTEGVPGRPGGAPM